MADRVPPPEFSPGTWWWGKEPDGRRVLYPKMTLENLDPWPPSNGSNFRCVYCKAEGTYDVLSKLPCAVLEAYHGDVHEYRRLRKPMRCLGKDALDGLPCCNEWVEQLTDGFAGERCPACGSSNTEEIA